MSIKNTETLSKFLKEGAILVVPTFQRPYAWKADQVSELFDDIVECQGQQGKQGKGLYLGSLILNMSQYDESKTIGIVDGQQRLTTLFLLLIACREHAKKQRALKEVFEAAFVAKTYDDKPAIYYIFDRINRTNNQKGAEPKEMFYPDETVVRKAHDIEHICSTAYNKRQSHDLQVKLIDNIGNLSVMSHYLNKSLDDKSPEEKGKLLRGKLATRAASYPEVQKLAIAYLPEEVCWNDKAIAKRASDLATLSYTTVWNF